MGIDPQGEKLSGPRPAGQGFPEARTERGWVRLLWPGYLAGGAVACKYPAVLFVLLPLAAWIWWFGAPRGRPVWAAWRPLGVFLLAAFLGCGLWFGKNWVLTGNPTYPLLYGVFDGKTRTPEKNRQWVHAHRPKGFSPTTLAQDLGRVGLSSEWLSPLVLPLAVLPLAVLAPAERRRRLVVGLMAYVGYVVAAWWLCTHRIDRFWIPALPVVALLAGAGACWSRELWWRRVLPALLVVGAVVNFPAADLAVGYRHYFVGLDRLRHDVDQPERPGRVNPWHHYLNTHVSRGRVLMVGDAEAFDLEVPVLYNTCFDDCLFEQLVRGRSAAEIRAAFAARDISYVYVDWAEIQRYRSPGNYGFSDFVQRSVFEELVRQRILEPLSGVGGRTGPVYRVRTDS